MQLPDDHRTGAAITLGAAFLASSAPRFGSQPFEHSQLRVEAGKLDKLFTQKKTDSF
jgi:hypothetical protein